MFTVVETPAFSKLCLDYWTEDERQGFAAWLAANPDAGDVVPGSGGCRKVRWTRSGSGKRGGVRVIYYNRLANGRIYLLLIYAKSANENIPAQLLLKIKEAFNADD
ncbi:MAG: transcriptional regulator [Gammaproteobacteria bacterium]|nr:transcriptional regulator [Gammaproteobacteria bacterium]